MPFSAKVNALSFSQFNDNDFIKVKCPINDRQMTRLDTKKLLSKSNQIAIVYVQSLKIIQCHLICSLEIVQDDIKFKLLRKRRYLPRSNKHFLLKQNRWKFQSLAATDHLWDPSQVREIQSVSKLFY